MGFDEIVKLGSSRTGIAMLHRVEPLRETAFGHPSCYRLRGTSLTFEELEEVLDRMSRIISLEEVETALGQGRPLPPGWVLTFDDGYLEHEEVARRLARRGAAGTFYVLGEANGAGETPPVVDAWYFLLDHARNPVAEVQHPVTGRTFPLDLRTLEGKMAWVIGAPKIALLEASPSEQWAFVDALADAVGTALPADLCARTFLSPSGWKTLESMGMSVGAHGLTHARLPQLSPADRSYEISESVRRLERSHPSFAYPDGAHDSACVEDVRASGASSAVTCVPGWVESASDVFRLPRFNVPPRGRATPSHPKEPTPRACRRSRPSPPACPPSWADRRGC